MLSPKGGVIFVHRHNADERAPSANGANDTIIHPGEVGLAPYSAEALFPLTRGLRRAGHGRPGSPAP
jgi:hypothetical protein